MGESLEEKLARIGDEAEAGEEDQTDRPIPAGVKVSRPNRARSKTLQVRLNPAEYEALERIAALQDVTVSALARTQLLNVVRQSARAMESTADQVSGLLAAMAEITEKLQETLAKPSGEHFLTKAAVRSMTGAPTVPEALRESDTP